MKYFLVKLIVRMSESANDSVSYRIVEEIRLAKAKSSEEAEAKASEYIQQLSTEKIKYNIISAKALETIE